MKTHFKQEIKRITKWNKHRLNRIQRHSKDISPQQKGCQYKRVSGFDARMQTMT